MTNRKGNLPCPYAALEAAIEAAWEARDSITATKGEILRIIRPHGPRRIFRQLARGGKARAGRQQWAKKAVPPSFRLTDMYEISGSNGGSNWWDKVPSKWKAGRS